MKHLDKLISFHLTSLNDLYEAKEQISKIDERKAENMKLDNKIEMNEQNLSNELNTKIKFLDRVSDLFNSNLY